MVYEVLARRWRPQQFDDVVGQEHVIGTLKNAITSGRLAHAYLFVGPRGIGKTSIARILAKALNCVNGPTVKPCDKCDSCREIIDGRSMDVLEIDGASNNGVEQVRELRETVKYLPARGACKVYIIDEVHMLSQGAFNALLKTLEEPPPHVKFIFATTEPQKIPATILSRCQRFDLRKISTELIIRRLGEIAKAEQVKADDDALLAIARGAEGGLRDAESALDQLISFKGRTIVEEDVLSVFGLVSRKAMEDLADTILSGNVVGLMEAVARLDEAGKHMQRLVIELLQYFRDLLICAYAGDEARNLDVAESRMDTLKRQAALCSRERLLEIADMLIETDGRLRYALSKRTLLETSLIRCARAAVVVSIEQIIEQINRVKSAAGYEESATGGDAAPARAAEEKRPPAILRDAETAAEPGGTVKNQPPKAESRSGSGGTAGDLNTHWREVVEETGKTAPIARNALLDARVVAVDGNQVTVAFDPEFETNMKNIADNKRHRMALCKAFKTVLGHDVEVKFVLIREAAAAKLPSDVEAPAGRHSGSGDKATAQAPAKDGAHGKSKAPGKSLEEWMKDDAIRKTLEAFDGEIIHVREVPPSDK